jgi:hypothetical protein
VKVGHKLLLGDVGLAQKQTSPQFSRADFSVGPMGDYRNERARQLLNTEATLLSFRFRDVRQALKLVP